MALLFMSHKFLTKRMVDEGIDGQTCSATGNFETATCLSNTPTTESVWYGNVTEKLSNHETIIENVVPCTRHYHTDAVLTQYNNY